MKTVGINLFFVMLSFLVIPAFDIVWAQERFAKKAVCALDIPNGVSAPEGDPKLISSPFEVPQLRFQFKDLPSVENSIEIVRIFYMWEWWRYPSLGNARGRWDEAGDIVECKDVNAAEITIPSYRVVPKGWYSGEFANSRKNAPRFHHLEVAFETKECGAPRILFDKHEIAKFRHSVVVVSLPCGGRLKYEFIKDESIALRHRPPAYDFTIR